MQAAEHRTLDPNGFTSSHLSTAHGWISSDAKKKNLLYVSDEGDNLIDIFSVPSYSKVGEIVSGIDQPEGIATDKKGDLYVSNLSADTITVYKRGATSPYRILTESDGPDDVAVATNGYVVAGDNGGGVDVYAPGATSPSLRLTNSDIVKVKGVGVDAHNNVYAAGYYGSSSAVKGVVIKFADMSGGGTNLDLLDMSSAAGVLVDSHNDIVVSEYNNINIYPHGDKSPSSTISVGYPDRSALNKKENLIYVPQTSYNDVKVLDYPSGKSVKTISIGNFASGAALSPAPKP
jgi:hypothetical protein